MFMIVVLFSSMWGAHTRPVGEGCGEAAKEGHHCPCYTPIASALLGSLVNKTLGSCVGYLLTRALRRYFGEAEGRRVLPRQNRGRRRGWTRLGSAGAEHM